MIRRWLAERSEQELRNILSEEVLKPCWMVNKRGEHCLVGAAAHLTEASTEADWDRAITMGGPVRYRFDALCYHRRGRFGNVRTTRLIHEACLRELVRRGPTVPTLVPALEETSV